MENYQHYVGLWEKIGIVYIHKKRVAKTYNRNYGGFDCVRIHWKLQKSVTSRKKTVALIP